MFCIKYQKKVMVILDLIQKKSNQIKIAFNLSN